MVCAISLASSRDISAASLPMYVPRHAAGIFLPSITARMVLAGHPLVPLQILQLHDHMFRILVSVGWDKANPPWPHAGQLPIQLPSLFGFGLSWSFAATCLSRQSFGLSPQGTQPPVIRQWRQAGGRVVL
jgi:hypothetical protein